MREILGFSISDFPFDLSDYVGVLMFHEYPVIEVYKDSSGQPIIKEWVDCDIEREIDRYFIFRTNSSKFAKFIYGEYTHLDLINSAENNIGVLTDTQEGEYTSYRLLSVNNLPTDYLPSYDSFFDSKDGVHLDEIVDTFSLKEKYSKNEQLDGLKLVEKLSNKYKTETFNIHLNQGKGVGFGRINTELLGRMALKFDELYKQVALDQEFGKTRGSISSKELKDVEDKFSTEVYQSKAASYSIFLRPTFAESSLFDDVSKTEKIAHRLFELFQISNEEELLEKQYSEYTDFVFQSYLGFLGFVSKSNVKLDLNWYNPKNTNNHSTQFSLVKADRITSFIERLETKEVDNFEIIGKFRELNCDTGHFTFISNEEESFSGYFSDTLQERITQIDFKTIYNIEIERETTKKAGSKSPSVDDTIVSRAELNE